MSIESIVEAFARGLAQGFAQGAASTTPTPARRGTGRRKLSARNRQRAGVVEPPSEPPQQQTIFDTPEIIAPPFTQAQAEAMERRLRGEAPQEKYVPGEGVAPWQGS